MINIAFILHTSMKTWKIIVVTRPCHKIYYFIKSVMTKDFTYATILKENATSVRGQ